MASYQETVDEIRGYVAAGSRTPTQACVARADEFADACRDVNDRLRRCHDALQRGLRSDAIHLAEAEPNLLDMVAMLDFPEIQNWKALCQAYDLTAPPELLIEMAAALNEAYASEQPLVNLMASHRVMALARAPLSERLIVMRHIAQLDSGAGFWDDDIQKFEQARLDEIRTQLNTAGKSQDATAVSRLNDEIHSSIWRVSIPAELKRAAKESVDRLVSLKAIGDLRKLVPTLNDAYGGMAYDECKVLLGQWLATVAAARLAVPDDLQEQIEPILDWVQEQDHNRQQQFEFDEACTRLEQALDTDQPTQSLERAYQAALPFHLEIPEELDKRYQQKLVTRASAIRHRRRLMYTGIAAAFLLVAGTVAIILYQHILSREVSDSQSILADAQKEVEHGELEKGEAIKKQLTEQHAHILIEPRIMKSLSDFDAAAAIETQREADFQKHYSAAKAGGPEKPNEKELDQASAIAKSPSESSEIEDFKSNIAQYRACHQQDIDHQFAADATVVGTELDSKLPQNLMSVNPDEYGKQLQALTKSVEQLRQRAGISTELKQAQLASLDAVLTKHQQDYTQQQVQGQLLEGIKNFGSTAARHAESLKQFIASCPADPREQDFQLEVARLPAEQAVEDWATLVKRWLPAMLPNTLVEAKERSAEVQRYLDTYPASPIVEPVQAYQGYLKMGLDALSPDGPWKGKLGKLLENQIVGKLYFLDTNNGLRFYVLRDVQIHDGPIAGGGFKGQVFNAITVPDVSHPSEITGQLLKSSTPTKSAQAVFADQAQIRIDALAFNGWDEFGIDVVQNLLSQRDMNPVLKAILLQHILQLDQPTAEWSGQLEFAVVAASLSDQNVEDIAWLDPRQTPDADTIAKLQRTMQKLPSLQIARENVSAHRQSTLDGVRILPAGEGILLHENSTYKIRTAVTASSGEVALVVGPDNKLEQVGQFRDSRWLVDSTKAGAVPDGSLIFINSPAK